MTHGGARANAGRNRTQLDEVRLRALLKQGCSHQLIANRFGVGRGVIAAAIRRLE